MENSMSLVASGAVGADVAGLAFADPGVAMSVRAFVVPEGLDRGFEVLVTAASHDAEVDFERIVGRGAALRLAAAVGDAPRRVWSGVCREVEQISVEESGLSIYLVRVVPMLWRLTQRTGRRLFQHLTGVELACAVFAEWGITPELRLQESVFPRHELRTQLDETDYAFVTRMLEEAGVSYWFGKDHRVRTRMQLKRR
jgi:type VI secretion system secreted protein VgrG